MPQKMKVINSWDEVPRFTSKREEHEFWKDHDLSEELRDIRFSA